MEVKRAFVGNLLRKFSGNSWIGKTAQAGLSFFAGYMLTDAVLLPVRKWELENSAEYYKSFIQGTSDNVLRIVSKRKSFCENWKPIDPAKVTKCKEEVKICDEITKEITHKRDEILARIEDHKIV